MGKYRQYIASPPNYLGLLRTREAGILIGFIGYFSVSWFGAAHHDSAIFGFY